MSTVEIIVVFLGTFSLVYILGSMSNPWTKPLEPIIEYRYYSYSYLNQWSDKYVIKSSVFVGSFEDLVQYLNVVQPNSVILFTVLISKAEFEALK